MIFTFLMSPLGRKVGLGVLLIIALFIALKVHDHSVFQKGQAEGVRTTVLSTEKQLKQNWAASEKTLAAKQKELDITKQDLEAAHTVLAQEHQNTITKIKEDDLRLRTKIGTVIPHEVEAMPIKAVEAEVEKLAPSPVEVLIAFKQNGALQEALAAREKSIQNLIDESDRDERNASRRLEIAEAQTETVKAQLATMTEERDFYQNAVTVLTKKKCGVFKKIVTFGLACRG